MFLYGKEPLWSSLKEVTYVSDMESNPPYFESKYMELKGGMLPEGLLTIRFKIMVLKEDNRCVGSNNPYKIPKCVWVMMLLQINNFSFSLFPFFCNFFEIPIFFSFFYGWDHLIKTLSSFLLLI